MNQHEQIERKLKEMGLRRAEPHERHAYYWPVIKGVSLLVLPADVPVQRKPTPVRLVVNEQGCIEVELLERFND